MRYLSRAIPITYENRYILTSDDKENWCNLGLIPIIFESGNFGQLNISLKQLADFVNRNRLDWNIQIEKLSKKDPSLITDEEKDEIIEIFQDPIYRGLFIDKLNSLEWLRWIDEEGYLENIFNDKSSFSELDSELSGWLVGNFLLTHTEEIALIYYKHNCNINKAFHGFIIRKIDITELNTSEFEKLMYFVNIDLLEGYEIAKSMNKSNVLNSSWYTIQLLKRLIRFQIRLKHDNIIYANNERKLNNLEIKFLEGQSYITYSIQEYWNELNELESERYKELLLYLTTEINKFELIRKAWNIQSELGLYINLQLLEEERSETSIIGIILRDITENLTKRDPEFMKRWILENTNSSVLLIKKISIFSLRSISSIDTIEKIEQIVKNQWLFKQETKQEVFLLVKEIFDKLDKRWKAYIIYQIMKFIYKPKINLSENERKITEAYMKFNWLVWLERECEYYQLIPANIKMIKSEYSYFEPRNNPELNISITEVSPIEDKSPIVFEDINTPEKITASLDILLNYKGEKSFDSPNRFGLLRLIRELPSEYKDGAISLMEQLLKEEYYETDLWESLLAGIEVSALSKEELFYIIKITNQPKLIEAKSQEVSHFLYKVSVNLTQLKLNIEDLDILRNITISLWMVAKSENNDYQDLHTQTLNTADGNISWSWINLFKYEMKINHIEETFLKYGQLFTGSLKSKESKELYFVLAANFGLFYYYNEKWTIKKILPLLSSENEAIYSSTWEGFLTYAKLSPQMIEIVRSLFLDNIKNISSFESNNQDRFIRYYTTIMIHGDFNPIKEFLPTLFEYVSSDMLIAFYSQVSNYLRNSTVEKRDILWEKWLIEYLNRRKNNIPKKLLYSEVNHILYFWLENTGKAYPQVIEFIDGVTFSKDIDGYFLSKLEESDLITEYPESTKKLLLKCLYELSRWKLKDHKKQIENIYKSISANHSEINKFIVEKLEGLRL